MRADFAPRVSTRRLIGSACPSLRITWRPNASFSNFAPSLKNQSVQETPPFGRVSQKPLFFGQKSLFQIWHRRLRCSPPPCSAPPDRLARSPSVDVAPPNAASSRTERYSATARLDVGSRSSTLATPRRRCASATIMLASTACCRAASIASATTACSPARVVRATSSASAKRSPRRRAPPSVRAPRPEVRLKTLRLRAAARVAAAG
jgi:hypothetical protein